MIRDASHYIKHLKPPDNLRGGSSEAREAYVVEYPLRVKQVRRNSLARMARNPIVEGEEDPRDL